MERTRALIASSIVAGVCMTGAIAYAASSTLVYGRGDNVGQLQTTSTQVASAQPAAITVVVDPTTGIASVQGAPIAQAPPATGQSAAPSASASGSAVTPDGDRSTSESESREHGEEHDD